MDRPIPIIKSKITMTLLFYVEKHGLTRV